MKTQLFFSSQKFSQILSSLYFYLHNIESRINSINYFETIAPHYIPSLIDDCLVCESKLQVLLPLFSDSSFPLLLTSISSIRLSLVCDRPITVVQKGNFSESLNSYYRFILELFPVQSPSEIFAA